MSQLTVPLGNGIGRYMCQLKRIVFNYCKYGGSSRGMRWRVTPRVDHVIMYTLFRKYIDEEVVQFANANPQVAVYVSDRHMRHPRIIGVYCEQSNLLLIHKCICITPQWTVTVKWSVWRTCLLLRYRNRFLCYARFLESRRPNWASGGTPTTLLYKETGHRFCTLSDQSSFCVV